MPARRQRLLACGGRHDPPAHGVAAAARSVTTRSISSSTTRIVLLHLAHRPRPRAARTKSDSVMMPTSRVAVHDGQRADLVVDHDARGLGARERSGSTTMHRGRHDLAHGEAREQVVDLPHRQAGGRRGQVEPDVAVGDDADDARVLDHDEVADPRLDACAARACSIGVSGSTVIGWAVMRSRDSHGEPPIRGAASSRRRAKPRRSSSRRPLAARSVSSTRSGLSECSYSSTRSGAATSAPAGPGGRGCQRTARSRSRQISRRADELDLGEACRPARGPARATRAAARWRRRRPRRPASARSLAV